MRLGTAALGLAEYGYPIMPLDPESMELLQEVEKVSSQGKTIGWNDAHVLVVADTPSLNPGKPIHYIDGEQALEWTFSGFVRLAGSPGGACALSFSPYLEW